MSESTPSSWFSALTLEERRVLFPKYLRANAGMPLAQTEAASATLDMWREVPSLTGDASFGELLDFYEMTPKEFVQLLSVPPDAFAPYLDIPPSWATFASASLNRDRHGSLLRSPSQEPARRLLQPVEPIVIEGVRRLEADMLRLEALHDTPLFERQQVLDEYRRVVSESLLEIVIKSLVVEMHIASRSGALHDNDPSTRFEEFMAQFSDSGATRLFLDRYPVIVRIGAVRVQQTVAALSEMMHRVCSDRSLLQRHFGQSLELGKLIAPTLGLGDPHRRGRTVAQLEFESGVRIIYKPRSLRIDLQFQKVLSFVARKLERMPFRHPILIDRGSYGYMEFVESHRCTSREEAQRFFYRHGVQLAILYLMGGTDVNSENVLACGEHPVLVDLETLFTSGVSQRLLRPAERLAETTLRESVLSSGLLPNKIKLDPELEPIDFSGLGGEGDQVAALRIATWHDIGTDLMHMKRETTTLPAVANLPTLGQERLTPVEFWSDIVMGFSDAFVTLNDSRMELRELLLDCAKAPVRAILRFTYEYAFVLSESYHPYLLADAIDRDRFFDQLWAGARREPELQQVYGAERSDLWRGDIPFFTTLPDSNSLWTSSGDEIPGFFCHTGLEGALRRLESLTKEELFRQVWFIRSALTAPTSSHGESFQRQRLTPGCPQSPMDVALAIGDLLFQQAFVNEGEATWISLIEAETGYLIPVIAGVDLYAGLPGIVLFLAYLGRVSGRQEYSELARAGLNNLIAGVEQRNRSKLSCGAFDGIGGVLYTLTHLAVIFDDPSLLALADKYVEKAKDLADTDVSTDVVSGAAGCLLTLLANYALHGNKTALQVAKQYGNLLLDQDDGHGWFPRDASSLLTDGFGHGPLGVVYALRQLYAATMERRYAKAAGDALSSLYCCKTDTLSVLNNAFAGPHTWCRGFSGYIGALLRMLPDPKSDWLSGVIDNFVERAYNAHLLESDCVCHGELGNLDFSFGAEIQFSDRRWRSSAVQRAQQLLERASTEGWACGMPVPSPGLMDGFAGIGYQLLRMAAPHKVPSVLFLEPPIVSNGTTPIAPSDGRGCV